MSDDKGKEIAHLALATEEYPLVVFLKGSKTDVGFEFRGHLGPPPTA